MEVSTAISEAANQDPLFPSKEEGCFLTAALLVLLAIQRSDVYPSKVAGKRMGLYQIEPPSPMLNGKLLLNPRSASLIAIDLMRTKQVEVTPKTMHYAIDLVDVVRQRLKI